MLSGLVKVCSYQLGKSTRPGFYKSSHKPVHLNGVTAYDMTNQKPGKKLLAVAAETHVQKTVLLDTF